jgi:hypothetical protein
MITRIVFCLLIAAPSALLTAQSPATDRTEVIATVQGFFDSMAKRDPDLARRVMMPDARLYAITEPGGAVTARTVRTSTAEDFIKGLTTSQGALLERMWEPEVRVQAGIATLWTRYDFYRGGTFSHCGTDAVDLVKTPEGWKIAGVMYTIERTGCAPSPLGPPK